MRVPFSFVAFDVTVRPQNESMDSDEDASSEARLGEERGGPRRFFARRRKFSGDVAALSIMASAEQRHHNADAAPQGPLRRRMSHVMTRRSRTLPTVASESSEGRVEGDGGGDAVTASSKESLDDTKSGDVPPTDTRGGVGEDGLDTVTETNREIYGAVDDAEDKAKEAEPPPFTMALAVMLTGLRLFVVDQVWFCHGQTRVGVSSMEQWVVRCNGASALRGWFIESTACSGHVSMWTRKCCSRM